MTKHRKQDLLSLGEILQQSLDEHEKEEARYPNRTKRALEIIEMVVDGLSIVGMARAVLTNMRKHVTREHREEIKRLRQVNRDLVKVNAILSDELHKANQFIENNFHNETTDRDYKSRRSELP